MIATLRDFNNIAKGRREMKGSEILQSVSRFLPEIAAYRSRKCKYN